MTPRPFPILAHHFGEANGMVKDATPNAKEAAL